jgi:hypothetical protein
MNVLAIIALALIAAATLAGALHPGTSSRAGRRRRRGSDT